MKYSLSLHISPAYSPTISNGYTSEIKDLALPLKNPGYTSTSFQTGVGFRVDMFLIPSALEILKVDCKEQNNSRRNTLLSLRRDDRGFR